MKKLFLLLAVIVATSLSVMAQSHRVSGVVVDADTDEPLVGASVQPVGGGSGSATDVDGRFTLNIPQSVKQITVSYIGYSPATVNVSDNMTVGLKANAQALDEVVVTGYGSGKKLGSLVGSVSVVGDQVLEDTPSANFVDALQGQVPGLTIFSNSGEPSATPESIRIRGVNSLNASTTPLFILDGAPTTSTIFNTLNPSDIESVTVLKDAASTAIYGSRAANGVIVITTKKGRYGDKATVTVRANVGWSSVAREGVELMNSKQYVEYRDKIGLPVSQQVLDLVNKYGVDTDWRDELIKDHALIYSLEARVQGGTEKTRYYISLGHYDQDGLIALSHMNRETLSTNIDSQVNDWFKTGISANFGFERYAQNPYAESRHSANAFNAAEALLPYDLPYYYDFDDNGNIVKGDKADYLHYSQKIHPNWLSTVYNGKGKRNRLSAMVNLYEQINPVKGLTIRTQQAVTAYDYRGSGHMANVPIITTPMGDKINISSQAAYASEAFTRYYQFTYTNTAEYRFAIDNHHAAVMLGQESIINKTDGFSVSTNQQPNSTQWLLTNGTAVTMDDISQTIRRTVINSWFANVTYDYANKYFLDFNIRRDGSSKFAPDHRWSTFYAVGAMWDAKQESFLADVDWLDQLRVRANYGTTGNSGIDDYKYQGIAGGGRIYNGENSMGLASQSNHDLTWETVKSFDFGLNFRVFDRVSVDGDFYVKNTHDMLMDIPYDFTTGYDEGAANVGSLRNTGFELQVTGDIYKDKDWYVGVTANVNYNRVRITELFNGLDKFTIPGTGVTYEVGKDPFGIHTVKYAGVDPRDGQQMWYDKDGNLTKQFTEDNEVDLGKSFVSPWNGGFGINARWKSLSLRADFNWSAQKYIFDGNYWYTRTVAQTTNANGSTDLLSVWTKPGDVTQIPNRFDLYGQPQEVQADSRFVENSSFVRLKNLTINYALPRAWVSAAGLKDVNVHFTGRNLLTFSPYEGADPEYEANVIQFSYPNTRQFEFGLEVTF